MRSTSLLTLALLGAVSSACSDDGGLTPDGGADPDPAAALIGTWRQVPSALAIDPPPAPEARRHLIYAADGSLTLREPAGSRIYDYVVHDDETVTATARVPSTPQAETYSYHLAGGVYLDNAMRPSGAVDGPIGTWTGVVLLDSDRLDKTWELRADRSAHLTFTRSGVGTWDYDGTWSMSGDDLRVIVRLDEVTSDVVYATLRDGVLGVPYEAVP